MVLHSSNQLPDNYNITTSFSYELSVWQKWAVWSIANNYNTVICAPTGSGKTCPAEFAIEHFIKLNKKIIYTSPIKALSNQKKYDFSIKYPQYTFGLLTGDIKDNPDADVIIMTTEILKNNLDKTDNSTPLDFNINIDTDIGIIIYDEAHYFNDAKRGHIWEECYIKQPKHVPMLLMSATLDNPTIFAEWLEQITNKTTVLAQTTIRQVPLYHYMWLSCNNNIVHKKIKDPIISDKIITNSNKLILLKYTEFNDKHYNQITTCKKELFKRHIKCSTKHLMNDVVNYLSTNLLTPAICFIYSRKLVEQYASYITKTLHQDSKKINKIESECLNILMKLPNYKEYVDTIEYTNIITLLEKGIAIHHSGMLPIFREMVEIMFSKGYVELLFATETFALGLNMPTKTVLFTKLSKFDGDKFRHLLGHEYTQQAGRAGRRGFDKKGTIIHLCNLFDMPNITDYKKILSGKPQVLESQFKLSYHLVLDNIHNNVDTIANNSLILNTIKKETDYYDEQINKFNKQLEMIEHDMNHLNTSKELLDQYHIVTQSKQIELELANKSIKNDYIFYKRYIELKENIVQQTTYKTNAEEYIPWTIQQIKDILQNNKFLNNNTLEEKGILARYLKEVDALSFADILIESNYLSHLNSKSIVGLLSIYCAIRVEDEYKTIFINNSNIELKYMIQYIDSQLNYYQDEEYKKNIYHNKQEIQYDIITEIMEWYEAEDESQCRQIIDNLKLNKHIFLGDFVKAILKIITIVSEIETMCIDLNKIDLLAKMRDIPENMLKYVAINQSLYV